MHHLGIYKPSLEDREGKQSRSVIHMGRARNSHGGGGETHRIPRLIHPYL